VGKESPLLCINSFPTLIERQSSCHFSIADAIAIKLEYFHANARVVPENGVNFTAEVDAARTWLQANHIFIEDEIWTTSPGT